MCSKGVLESMIEPLYCLKIVKTEESWSFKTNSKSDHRMGKGKMFVIASFGAIDFLTIIMLDGKIFFN